MKFPHLSYLLLILTFFRGSAVFGEPQPALNPHDYLVPGAPLNVATVEEIQRVCAIQWAQGAWPTIWPSHAHRNMSELFQLKWSAVLLPGEGFSVRRKYYSAFAGRYEGERIDIKLNSTGPDDARCDTIEFFSGDWNEVESGGSPVTVVPVVGVNFNVPFFTFNATPARVQYDHFGRPLVDHALYAADLVVRYGKAPAEEITQPLRNSDSGVLAKFQLNFSSLAKCFVEQLNEFRK
ncbi:MAG: hypothetical protein AB7P04_15210 [Bacteriovoracia bacterium]